MFAYCEDGDPRVTFGFFKTHHYIIFVVHHYTVSREWRVIVDQEQINYHGRPMVL